jgi:hypothetical protein
MHISLPVWSNTDKSPAVLPYYWIVLTTLALHLYAHYTKGALPWAQAVSKCVMYIWMCSKYAQCVWSVHSVYRCAPVCSSKFQYSLSTPDEEIRSKCAQYAQSKHAVCTWWHDGVHKYAQLVNKFAWGNLLTTEHTMCVLCTLLSNFVRIFYSVCTLCANLCEPACTACKCLRSMHSAYKKCTWGVSSMHSMRKAYTKCTGGVRSLQWVCTMTDMHATYPFCRSGLQEIRTPTAGCSTAGCSPLQAPDFWY